MALKLITSIIAGVLATSDFLKMHLALPIFLKEHGIVLPVINPVPKSDANYDTESAETVGNSI